MSEHLTAADHLAYLTAGADDTPRAEGAQYTPGQLLHRLHTIDVDERLDLLARLIESHNESALCFIEDHRGRLAELEELRKIGEWLVAEARWVATTALMGERAEAVARWTGTIHDDVST